MHIKEAPVARLMIRPWKVISRQSASVKQQNLILEENIMGKSYKPITSMKEVPEQLRKLRRQ
ncbi:hypothetical protein OBE_00799, partial [human gut metagenome]